MVPVPPIRVRALNAEPARPDRDFVLYWMTAYRRVTSNFSLDRAIEHARALGRPLVILEALRSGYPFASDRLHAFVLQGMGDNARALDDSAITYWPYVEPEPGAGGGLVEALARDACVLVTDDWPSFFVPRMQAALAARVDVRVEAVDSNGLFPMRATDRVFTTAHSFRIHLQKALPEHLAHFPARAPLAGLRLPAADLPTAVAKRWPRASDALLAAEPAALARLPIDHSVPAVAMRGGARAGQARLAHFVEQLLPRYATGRNEPSTDGTSALSAHLHFGHVGAHEVFAAIATKEGWSPASLRRPNGGAKAGWWGLSADAEAYVDQLVTWRELSFNAAALDPNGPGSLDSLPDWAKATHRKHAKDPRPRLYALEQLERAATHDPVWNAAQTQLVRDGWFHNYLRMVWGKKIFEWSSSAQEALERMRFLMGKYALDGRDPVSEQGYLWVLGRYDRAWGPERAIFGTVRYMSSENTAKKLDLDGYLARYGAARQGSLGL